MSTRSTLAALCAATLLAAGCAYMPGTMMSGSGTSAACDENAAYTQQAAMDNGGAPMHGCGLLPPR